MVGGGGALVGRADETARIAELLAAARAGRSAVLVLRGEPGIGKTALLDHTVQSATGFQVLRVTGVEVEQLVTLGGLDRLLRPLRDRIDRLPAHHARALHRAAGDTEGPPPQPYLIALAALELLSSAGQDGPVLAVVDDAQWLDVDSLTALTFLARRMAHEPVALLIAARTDDAGTDALTVGIDQLTLDGLDPTAATGLLRSGLRAPVDPMIAARVATATGGNPLALIDLAEDLTARELASTGLDDGPLPIGHRLAAHYARRITALDAPARRWLLLAAAESSGDAEVIESARRELGLSRTAAEQAEDAGLIRRDPVRFRHPLVRAADVAGRTEAAAWHEARAVHGTDEAVAARLEQVAGSGSLTRARLLNRAAELTPAGPTRARRSIAAAEAAVLAGAAQLAADLLDEVDTAPLDPVEQGRVLVARAQIGVFLGDPARIPVAGADLVRAADMFRDRDPGRETRALLLAFDYLLSSERRSVGLTPGELGVRMRSAAADPGRDDTSAVVLTALAAHLVDPFTTAVPTMRRGLATILGLDPEAGTPYVLPGVALASALWDAAARREVLDRAAASARQTGALRTLDGTLWTSSLAELTGGTPLRANRLIEQVRELRRAIGYPAEHVVNAALLAWQDADRSTVEQIAQGTAVLGFGGVESSARNALAQQDIARGAYRSAARLLDQELAEPFLQVTPMFLADAVEAYVRSGQRDRARGAAAELAERAAATESDWARGLSWRCTALLDDSDRAGGHYLASIRLLERAHLPVDTARSHLVHGEWLRRVRRRAEAATALRHALDGFLATGAVVFAARARTELDALGLTDHTGDPTPPLLTPREDAVARLAAGGATNAEIGATLFISAHTVDYHPRKVFMKLQIGSRRQLAEHL